MDMKNEDSITKGYGFIMMLLMFAMALLNVIAVFVPAFSVDSLFVRVNDLGISFLGMNFGETDPVALICADSVFLSDEVGWQVLIKLELLFMLGVSVIGGVVSALFKPPVNSISPINMKYSLCLGNIGTSFFFNTVYTLTTFLLCFIKLNDLSLKPVVTFTFIPWIFCLGVYIASKVLHNHKNLAIKGLKKPIRVSEYTEKKTSVNDASDDSYTNKAQSKPVNENDNVELLMKYKELLDNGVIKEDEYQQKKSEILNGK